MSEVDNQVNRIKEYVGQKIGALNERQRRQEEPVRFKDPETNQYREEMLNERWLESMVCSYSKREGLNYNPQCATFVNRDGEKTAEGGRCDVAIRLCKPGEKNGRLLLLELKLAAKNNVFSDFNQADSFMRGGISHNSTGSSDNHVVLTKLHQYDEVDAQTVGALKEEARDQAINYARSVARRGFLEGAPKRFNHQRDQVHAASIVVTADSVHASHDMEFPPGGVSDSEDSSSEHSSDGFQSEDSDDSSVDSSAESIRSGIHSDEESSSEDSSDDDGQYSYNKYKIRKGQHQNFYQKDYQRKDYHDYRRQEHHYRRDFGSSSNYSQVCGKRRFDEYESFDDYSDFSDDFDDFDDGYDS